MKSQQSIKSIAIVTLLAASLGMLPIPLSIPSVQAQQTPFLITPYYGTKAINSWFDHEYPTYVSNNIFTRYDGGRMCHPVRLGG
jgi:hypothetical protein